MFSFFISSQYCRHSRFKQGVFPVIRTFLVAWGVNGIMQKWKFAVASPNDAYRGIYWFLPSCVSIIVAGSTLQYCWCFVSDYVLRSWMVCNLLKYIDKLDKTHVILVYGNVEITISPSLPLIILHYYTRVWFILSTPHAPPCSKVFLSKTGAADVKQNNGDCQPCFRRDGLVKMDKTKQLHTSTRFIHLMCRSAHTAVWIWHWSSTIDFNH